MFYLFLVALFQTISNLFPDFSEGYMSIME
jgi:hypothetical protein